MAIVENLATNSVSSDTRTESHVFNALLADRQMFGRIGHTLCVFDALLIAISAYLASYIFSPHNSETVQCSQICLQAGQAIMGSLLFYVFASQNNYLFSTPAQGKIFNFSKILAWLSATFIMLLLTGTLLQTWTHMSISWFGTWFAFALVSIITVHLLGHMLLHRLAANGAFHKHIAILASDASIADKIQTQLQSNQKDILSVTIFLGQQINDLIKAGQDNSLDQVIIALSQEEEPYLLQAISKLDILPIDIHVCFYDKSANLSFKHYEQIGDLELHLIHAKPICGLNSIKKSILDYSVAIISLIIFGPIMLLIALAIKLDSQGPVLFRQRRHGFNHKQIEVFKFRTMTVMEDGDVIKQAQKDDSRITWVGSFLRKTSLDELPQLFNVLKGEMSVVGPRPHALAHNYEYSELIEKYSNRHKVKPGITGWAQVHGFRGPTHNLDDMKKRAEYDLQYIDNWSIWLDLKILVMTPIYGFIGRNAF